jgi:hypothetical protein
LRVGERRGADSKALSGEAATLHCGNGEHPGNTTARKHDSLETPQPWKHARVSTRLPGIRSIA